MLRTKSLKRSRTLDAPKDSNSMEIESTVELECDSPDYVKIVCVGNTFGQPVDIPPGDIFIHLGNFIMNPCADETTRLVNTRSIENLYPHLEKLSPVCADYRVLISGEQERDAPVKGAVNSCGDPCNIYLDGAATLLFGLRIHAATTIFDDAIVFNPFDCINDIVISHRAPFGILDAEGDKQHTGCPIFLRNLLRFPPRVCIFAGPSNNNGTLFYNGTTFINCGSFQYYKRPMNEFEAVFDILFNNSQGLKFGGKFRKFGGPITVLIPTKKNVPVICKQDPSQSYEY